MKSIAGATRERGDSPHPVGVIVDTADWSQTLENCCDLLTNINNKASTAPHYVGAGEKKGVQMAIATRLQNPTTMANTVGYEGFSWTCFFFGPFPAIFRGDVVGFLVMVVSAAVTLGLSGLVWMFAYNRWHYNRLLAKGYQPAGFVSLSNNVTINNGFDVPSYANLGTTRFAAERRTPAVETNNGSRTVSAGFGKRF